MDDRDFRRLLDLLNLSWQGYARVRKGVKKRLRRHMRELGAGSVEAYFERIENEQGVRAEVGRLMAVPISRFFRDADLWQALEREVIPAILGGQPEKVRVWSAGCAMGQEVYSFRILWLNSCDGRATLPAMVIRATDINPVLLEKARTGIYPASSLAGMKAEARDRYFRPVSGRWYAVSDELKEQILWEKHDLVLDPIKGQFQIVFMRNNLLTYYRKPVQASVLAQVTESLAEGGFLVIGRREKIPRDIVGLVPFGRTKCLFRKERGGNGFYPRA